MELTLEGRSERATYHLMTQLVLPRPIAWALTDNGPDLDDADRWNLAPFSYFNGVSSAPATVAFSIGNGMAGREKDTCRNLRERPHVVVHIPAARDAADVQRSAADLPPAASEVALLGRRTVAWPFPVPRIEGPPVALAGEVRRLVDLDDGGRQVLVLAEVVRIHVDDAAVTRERDGEGRERVRVDPAVVDPLCRLGAGTYATLGPPFTVPG